VGQGRGDIQKCGKGVPGLFAAVSHFQAEQGEMHGGGKLVALLGQQDMPGVPWAVRLAGSLGAGHISASPEN
jgi:hypothetical protein